MGKRLAQNKLVSFPKWYHCTYSIDVLQKIAKEGIKVSKRFSNFSFFPKAAFVSNRPELTRGPLGIAMSNQIEKIATTATNCRIFYPPVRTRTIGPVEYSTKRFVESTNSSFTQLWIGFQLDILLSRPNKSEDPLGYYENAPIAFFFYTSKYHEFTSSQMTNEDIEKGQQLAKKIKVEFLNESKIVELSNFINLASILTLPEEWKEYLEIRESMDSSNLP